MGFSYIYSRESRTGVDFLGAHCVISRLPVSLGELCCPSPGTRENTTIGGLRDTVAVAARQVRLTSGVDTSNMVQIVFDGEKKHWLCVTN